MTPEATIREEGGRVPDQRVRVTSSRLVPSGTKEYIAALLSSPILCQHMKEVPD